MAKQFDFRTVQLHLTDQCNLRCSYCYEDRAQRSSKVMSIATAQEIAARHLNEEGSHERVEFDFIGGEPLLVWDMIVSLVEYVHQHEWPKKYGFSFTTNGTLFTDEIKSWLDQHCCMSFGFSIDGTRAAHNLNRSDSYDRMIQHVPWALERYQRMGMEKRVKMTISAETVPMIAEGIAELHAMGFDHVDANVPYENIWGDRLEASLAAYAEQLDAVVEFYLQHPELEPARLVDLPLGKIFEEKNEIEFPRWCGSGNPMICYDVEGRAFPCHRFVNVSIGRVFDGPLTFPVKTWDEVRKAEPSLCVECPFVAACPSCMALNWLENGDVDRRTHWHCGFILLQMKASAKFSILRLSREIAAAPPTEEGRRTVSELQLDLDQAMHVHEMLSGQSA
jgi:radical SAM protein with 4Fe4S-binding SPASM domain